MRIRFHGVLVFFATLASGFFIGAPAKAQVEVAIPTSEDPIPTVVHGTEIKSWSLFLICEPDWILRRDSDRLWELYDQFRDFGAALGPEHAAVWFWARDPGDPGVGEIHTAIDVVRSRAFCSILGEEALPSLSPHLLVTSEYPGPGFVSDITGTFRAVENMAVVSLGGRDAAEIEEVLQDVIDGVYAGEIADLNPGTEGFWRAWQGIFEAIQAGMAEGTRSVTFKIKSGFFEFIIGGG